MFFSNESISAPISPSLFSISLNTSLYSFVVAFDTGYLLPYSLIVVIVVFASNDLQSTLKFSLILIPEKQLVLESKYDQC